MMNQSRLPGTTAKAESPSFGFRSLAAALLASALLLGACNTIEGMGDDAEEAGEEVEDAID